MPHGFILPNLEIAALLDGYQAELFTPTDVVRAVVRRRDACADGAVWIHRVAADDLLGQAASVEKRRAAGEALPLYGAPFAVKDNIDVEGCSTTAGCPAFAYKPAVNAPVVAELLNAGAIFVGKTNLDQFGTGLAGDRTPYGACRNVFDNKYISGGSSSGSAIAVAAGLVSFALATDTAGSGRVPAGCNNIVGLKPPPGFISTQGLVPSCQSLDCISILALTVGDAELVCSVAEKGGAVNSQRQPVRESPALTFAAPREEDWEFIGDNDQAALFREALSRLEKMGLQRVPVDFKPFRDVASLLYEGPWVAERLASIEAFLKKNPESIHPVTRSIIEGGGRYSAVDVFKAYHKLGDLRQVCMVVFDRAEVLVVPTLPTIPTLAEVKADSVGWSRRLGYYTNFANLLGLAALAVPSGFTPGGLPGGITLLGPPGTEQRLCELGSAWQRDLNLPLGASGEPSRQTGESSRVSDRYVTAPAGFVRVAVAGAHLHGQPLHNDLRRTGARFVRRCRTAGQYRFVALMELSPPRPGLLRDDDRAGAVDVEIYDLPMEGFGMLVASVAPPLAIGTIQLADGESVKGFLCESFAAARARDITEFGGWVAFRDHLAHHRGKE